mmetsp:Transcript_11386/g.35136  ORF Transcript_11386/g.35136 Transcript_11386/m.35136 type:complete len:214 (+) Transcript_11386:4638-5279(+)
MYMLKCCCSFSLAKLISSCSSELRTKASKPKMSSRPIMRRASAPPPPPGFILSFIFASIQSKSEPYRAFASESRATAALSGGCGTWMTGNLPTDFTVRALSNASGSISSSAATASSEGKVDGRTREPSSCAAICTASKPMLPRLSTAARMRCMDETSCWPSWNTPKAVAVAFQSEASSMPATFSFVEAPRYLIDELSGSRSTAFSLALSPAHS